MSKIDVKALVSGMKKQGCSALANVLQDSVAEAPPLAQGAAKVEEAPEGKVDLAALKESAVREYDNRVDSVELKCEWADAGAAVVDSKLSQFNEALVKLQQESKLCDDCVQNLEVLVRAGKSTVPITCLDHMLDMLKALSLTDTLEHLEETIPKSITGRQMLNVYLETKNPTLSKLAYGFLLQRTFIYATFVPEFCSTIPFEVLRKLLEDDGLQVSNEDDVLEIVRLLRTLGADKLKKLLPCIRFPFLTCSTYDTLLANFPEVSMCAEYHLCEKSNNWMSHSPEKQLTRRKSYCEHLHVLWHEEPLEEDAEQLLVTCQREGKQETMISKTVTADLRSTVEARGRCAIVGKKVVVGADCGNKLWAWFIETSGDALSMPREKCLDEKLKKVEFLDATGANDDDKLISWRDIENGRCNLALLHLNKDDTFHLEKIIAPSSLGSRRGGLHKNFVIIINNNQLILFDKVTQTSSAYDSPGKSLSNFLDLLVVSNDKKHFVYVYDFRFVSMTDSKGPRYKDLLLVFDLELLRWQEESWDIDLESTNLNRRLYTDAYNGITLFEYRGHPAVMAEMGEDLCIRYKMIFIHDEDEDDEYTEVVADVSAVTDEGRTVREVLGVIPVDLNPCVHETVFNRHCRKNVASPQISHLRKLAE